MKLGLLQKKAVWQLAIYLLIPISLGGCASYLFLFRVFTEFEENTISHQLDVANFLISEQLSILDKFAVDYGLWDDTYNYMLSENQQYVESTYSYGAIKNIGCDFVVLLDRNKKVKLTAVTSDFLNHPTGTIEFPNDIPIVHQIIEKITDLEFRSKHKASIFFIDEQAYAIALSPITKSDGSGDLSGWVLMARHFNNPRMQHLQMLGGSKFGIQPSGTDRESNIVFYKNRFTAKRVVFSERPYTLILSAEKPLDYQSSTTYHLFIINLFTIWLSSLLFVIFSFGHLVINRLQTHAKALDSIRENKISGKRLEHSGKDEIDDLAASFNELLDEIDKQHHLLLFEATHDPLTSLGNRKRLNEQLKFALSLLHRKFQKNFCLLLIDLDGFKQINDVYGHPAGDYLLVEIAKRISISIRDSDCAVRLGGDEFSILLFGLDNLLSASETANRLRNKMKMPVTYKDTVLQVSSSIGLIFVDQHVSANLTPDDLLKQADIAMYEAKKNGRDQVVLFDKKMESTLIEYTRLAHDLRDSIVNDLLDVYFQPIISSDGLHLESLEVLGRWNHPEFGFIGPDRFIPIAENSHLIYQYSLGMIRKACSIAVANLDVFQGLHLSVNISVHELLETDFFSDLSAVLSSTHFPPQLLNLEITESSLAQSEYELVKPMQQCREVGIAFHIDDFGTGYSSLARLHGLPIAVLKVDKSFVRRIGHGGEVLIQAIIEMAHRLNMKVISEGVETETQLSVIQGLSCDYVQGYLFAKPMHVSQATTWLKAYIEKT
ncbi:diguanylate cyclase [Gammaproteobacteria bacterium]